jgi:hypothetical protein
MKKMFKKMFQGGPSKKKSPRLAIREPDLEPPWEALVQPCEWRSDYFITCAGFNEEFDMYVHNAGLTDFLSDKCLQYYDLTDSFVRRFRYSVHHNTHYVLFDLYDKSFSMDLEEFNETCKTPQWGIYTEPHKSDCVEFLASITLGETRSVTQATIGSIHFPVLHYFALFIGRCINGKHDHI